MPEATESVEKLQSGARESEDDVLEARNDAIDALLDGEFAVGVWQRTGGKGQFKAIWINEAFTRLTGYNLAEAQRLGERILRRRHRTMLSELINERGSSTTPIHASLPLRAKDGENVDVPVTMTIREDPKTGRPSRFIVAQRKSANSATRLLPENHSRGSLELIAKISEILVDYDEPRVLDSLARLIGRRLNTWCGFFVDAGVLRISEDVNEHVQLRRASTARGRTAADRRDPVGRLLSGSEAQSTRIYLDGEHAPGSPSAQLVDLIRQQVQAEAYTDTVLLYPLFGRARTLGVMAALPELGTEPEDGELQTVLYLAARRVGMVLDNAQLHHGEHTMVETLQRTMLPELDEIEDLDVWTYYAASSEHAQVGGDWYDVMDLPGDSSVLVIGDVAGHDIEAAAAMGQLRSVVRAFAAESQDPGDVLARVDRTVDSMRIRRAASLIYATLTPIEGSDDWDLRYSRAGHLPGLLLRDGHVEQLDGAGGRLIGFGVTERETAGTRLHPGDCVVLYTDGLVERRDRPLQEGVAALQAVLAEADHAEAAMVGESLVRNLAESPEDDVALVVMRVPEPATGPAAGPRQRQWRFPAAKESVQLARQAAAATCRTWGLDVANAVELVVSELVANAVLHAWGVVTVSLVDTGAGVRVEVEDENPMPPVPLERHPARVGGYGMHIVSRLADWGWRPSGVGKVVWARVTGELEGTGL